MQAGNKTPKYLSRLTRLIESGKFDDAHKLAVELARKYPRDADVQYVLAGLYARQGQLDRVINCCRQVISINPKHGGANYNLAAALVQTGETGEAESAFKQCLKIEPANVSALIGLGKLLLESGRHADAAPYFRKATLSSAKNAEAFYFLGVALQSSGDQSSAEKAYRQVIQLQPGHLAAGNNLGHILSEQGNFSESLTLFNGLKKQHPDCAQLYNNAGVVYESLGMMDEAEADYRKAIQLEPSLLETKSHLGYLLADEGRTADALECFRSALECQPDYEPAIAGQAVALEKLGMIDEAFKAIKPAVATGHRSPDIALAYCKIMLRKEEPWAGIEIARQALSSANLPQKGVSNLNFALGDLYEKTGDYATAFSHYKAANMAAPCTYKHDNHVRFIDRIIQHTRKDIFNIIPEAPPDNGARLIFIVGMPRSGTSLVEQILASHPDVFGAGELRFIGDIASSISAHGIKETGYPDILGSLKQADIQDASQRYLNAVKGLSDGSPLVTDKMPHNFLYIGLINRLLPNARFIHVSRNPMDNCLSLYFHSFNPMHSYTTDLNLLGMYYREYLRLMKHWKAVIDVPILDVSYEAIVEHQEQNTRGILEFCELGWSDKCLDFHNSGRFVKTPSYDQVRRPVYSSSVGRWKHYKEHLGALKSALEHPIEKAAGLPPNNEQ